MNFKFNANEYKYASKRNVVFSNRGMVATGNPMAAQSGIDVLKNGGNAIDAAIATAATLSVVEPTGNGLGGDSFALIWYKNKLYGLNGSGKSPKKIDPEEIKNKGYKNIPTEGLIPINVPGQVGAWSSMSKKFGKMKFKDLFLDAIDYADNGFIIQPLVSKLYKNEFNRFTKAYKNDEIFKEWFNIFAPNNRPLEAGELLKNKDLANTLREISINGSSSFYSGSIAYEIDNFMKKNNGYLRMEDLNEYKAEFVKPITTDYKGYTVAEIPPNGHGITVLMALNILSNFDLEDFNSPMSIHKQIEALKLAFTDVKKYVSDSDYMKVSIEELLSKEYSKSRAKLISDKANYPVSGNPYSGGTVYLATADNEGNMVSYIQSNYTQFGSGIVVPGTGLTLHNRGANFSLDENSSNYLMPNKKSYHTIIPGFLLKDNKPIGPFGVMGAFMQPQGHLQILLNTIEENLNPQDALNKPRWQWIGGKNIEIESTFNSSIGSALNNMGHNIIVKDDSSTFGRGEIIWKDNNEVFCGGCEPRTDASIAIW